MHPRQTTAIGALRRENATERLPCGKQDAAVLHFLGDGGYQTQNDFPLGLNKLESVLIEKANVFE